MADDEKESEVTPSRGADWEVVQLTASTYAAASDPKGFDPDDERNEQEPHSGMFMSDHFVFPPSEHENLLIEPESDGIHGETEDQDASPVEEIDFDDDKVLPQLNSGGEEEGMLPQLNTGGKEESMFASHEPNVISGKNEDSPKYTKSNEGDGYDGSGLPCEAWWKRRVACLYRHATESNTLWSVFVAAALMGLVILGKQWQQDKLYQLKWHINNERLNRVLGPAGRLKDVIVGSHRSSH